VSTGRTYAGASASDRAEDRRRRLLDAGLQVLGTDGYRAATVRRICREARVADRYFYECFDGTEALLLAVYAECTARLRDAVPPALAAAPGTDPLTLARAGLDAFLRVVEDDPRLARVVWFEVLGVSPEVEQTSLETMSDFGRAAPGAHRGPHHPLPRRRDRHPAARRRRHRRDQPRRHDLDGERGSTRPATGSRTRSPSSSWAAPAWDDAGHPAMWNHASSD
jgi:AcrR family transcriptional regulator